MASVRVFEYTNHEGKVATRTVVGGRIHWLDAPGWGYAPGWFLTGNCLDRMATRSFAFTNMRPAEGTPLSAAGALILTELR